MDIGRVFDEARPLSQRPPEKAGREASRFDSTWSSTLELLDREMRMLGAKRGSRILELDLPDTRIRIDGMPHVNATPATSYVAVRFKDKKGNDVFLDAAKYRDWKDNVRAIALSLEALRKVDRYGVARGRQYAGFLPPGGATVKVAMSLGEAAKALWRLSGGRAGGSAEIVEDPDVARLAARSARKNCHPDTGSGGEAWDRVEEARRVVFEHHGIES